MRGARVAIPALSTITRTRSCRTSIVIGLPSFTTFCKCDSIKLCKFEGITEVMGLCTHSRASLHKELTPVCFEHTRERDFVPAPYECRPLVESAQPPLARFCPPCFSTSVLWPRGRAAAQAHLGLRSSSLVDPIRIRRAYNQRGGDG